MKALYPLGTGSTWNNNELRYSLRSLQCVSDLSGVIIVGVNPGFLSGDVFFIPQHRIFNNPAQGIFENILAACRCKRTPETFLLVNDDYFFIAEVQAKTYPYYHTGQIKDRLKTCSGEYYNHLFTTQEELKRRGLPTLNFDSHYPMIVEKSKVLQLAEMYDWNRQYGYTFKSIYCNTFGHEVQAIQEGEFRPDCKVNAPHSLEWWVNFCSEREMFSIGDLAIGEGLIDFFRELFSEKSIFEK